jgi:chlorophyll synthase
MTRPSLSAVAELLKPITWFPPMWAFACGVVASGASLQYRWPLVQTGVAPAWIYSAPPLSLKLNGWWGNAACRLSHEGLAWITGAAVMVGGGMLGWRWWG